MKRSYLDYAMSVIVARALPDVRDGLKPVHRRILFAMHAAGYTPDKPYRKSARVVGDVIGKFHPHGESAVYDALVRMAQPFSMRLPLIDGQGNFGSMDGDPPAAMRYTEARLARATEALLGDIDKETVPFQPNYDESEHEPTVLPAAFPNVLVNGASGIAVGMATNIPTHNLGEVCDAAIAVIDNPAITLPELMEIIPGPDFPTGGTILGRSGSRLAFETGRGSVVIRARAAIEDMRGGRQAIIVTEVPYQVNKARLLEHIADLVREKKIEGISDLRDESDREGVRMVIELKRDAQADIVLNQLWRFTALQTSFGVNMLALNSGRPELMGLRQVLDAFLAFREDVIVRRARFELAKARDRAHQLVGLAIAVANIDEVIRLIRAAPDTPAARQALMDRDWPAADIAPLLALIDEPGNTISPAGFVRLTEAQARAILDLRLNRLTALERERIDAEMKELGARIAELLEILASRPRRLAIMRGELVAIRDAYATPRMTSFEEIEFEQDDESLIAPVEMVVTLTHGGYIKRVPLATFRAQRRGGKGRTGMATREDDFVTRIFVANTLAPVLFFSSRGMAYKLKVWRLPEAQPQARGRALHQLLPLQADETITAVLPLPQDETLWDSLYVLLATGSGTIRRNRLSDFANVRQNGLIAMKLDEGDRLIGVQTCREGDDVLLATARGKCTRFQIDDESVRVFSGRTSVGVRGIRLAEGDALIGMAVLRHVDASPEERLAYLRTRRQPDEAEAAPAAAAEEGAEDAAAAASLSPERSAELAEAEEFILTVTDGGFGKRSSAYEYRITNRGGSGIDNIILSERNGTAIVASFPATDGDQVMLVTDAGRLIRCPVDGIRIAGRRTQGVTLFRLEGEEHVTSVVRLMEEEGGEGGANGNGGDGNGAEDAAAADGSETGNGNGPSNGSA
ncbi:MAG: DNA gyrase subunit A [Alphaproteobacteria bacterium]|nr:DNA gyrase subunit A [Alphaproteobacteria bacterium]